MSEFKVASRYAKSLLSLSVEKKIEDKVFADMQSLIRLLESNRELKTLLSNPIIKSDKKYQILKSIFSKDFQELTIRFFEIVSKKGRDMYLLAIAKLFLDLCNEFKGITEAHLTTAINIDGKIKDEFVSILEKNFKTKIDLKENVNEDIIGGFIIKLNNRQVDESIKSRLNQLKLNLLDNTFIPQV